MDGENPPDYIHAVVFMKMETDQDTERRAWQKQISGESELRNEKNYFENLRILEESGYYLLYIRSIYLVCPITMWVYDVHLFAGILH